MFDKSPDPIMLLEVRDGMPTRYLDVNKTYAKQLGYSKSECIKIDPYSDIPESFLEQLPQMMETLYRDKKVTYEVSRIGKDKTLIPVEVTIYLFTGNEDQDVVLVLSHDISKRKRAELSKCTVFSCFIAIFSGGGTFGSRKRLNLLTIWIDLTPKMSK
ncbi:MAG: PAS domain S-box protein [Candidatus Hodarchaeota archaeon]